MAAAIVEMRSRADRLQDCPVPGPCERRLTSRPLRALKGCTSLAVPRRGHVLSTVAEFYGNPIRAAVAALSASLARGSRADSVSILGALHGPDHVDQAYRSEADAAAWFLVSIWVAGVAARAFPPSATLRDAERWFFGDDSVEALIALASERATANAEESLRAHVHAAAYNELLPYILDPHGPGSRLSVRRDPATRSVRSRRRANGVFYTPADVAEYMAGACLDALDTPLPPTFFDPACGTGVFVRAGLRELRRRYADRDTFSLAATCLFGADIDPWTLDATAFVLLIDTLEGANSSPVSLWRRLRRNFACVDTLQIDPASQPPSNIENRNSTGCRISISRLFPALQAGPSVILGNPPYADLGPRPDLADIASTFQTIRVKQQASAEIYLAFVEQMIRLTNPIECAGALVLPLSLACNLGPQFVTARKLIAETRGQWRFAFFDREPHALFGEDVKTRNAIVLWSRRPQDRRPLIATGPLRKWRGDSRATMFKTLSFTAVTNDIHSGVPKVDGAYQAAALKALRKRWTRLEQAVCSIKRMPLIESVNADERTVFVGPTAYNFLNVFLRPSSAVFERNLVPSEHPLHAITCASRQDAFAVFALLSSHLAYWWWHAHGDGFHVSGRFLSEFPFGADALSGSSGESLSRCGAKLWSAVMSNPIVSLNRGRTSLAFTPNGYDQMRRKADQVLADLVGLGPEFVDEVQQFTAHTVTATLRVHANSGTQEEI